MTEGVFQNIQSLRNILSHSAFVMGIGAYGDDFTTQFPETLNKFFLGQETTGTIHTAGVDLHALALGYQNPYKGRSR